MSFVLRKIKPSTTSFPEKDTKTDPRGELKIYHKAPRVNPAETQSAAWVSPLALDFFFLK